jgi:hypothetical protein
VARTGKYFRPLQWGVPLENFDETSYYEITNPSQYEEEPVSTFLNTIQILWQNYTKSYPHLDLLHVDLDSAKEQSAILVTPRYFSQGLCRKKYALALPSALNIISAVPLSRVWILSPTPTEEAEFVRVSSAYLIGPELDTESQDQVRLREKVSVTTHWAPHIKRIEDDLRVASSIDSSTLSKLFHSSNPDFDFSTVA